MRLKTTAQYQSPGDPRNNAILKPGVAFTSRFQLKPQAENPSLNFDLTASR
ncbi:hypothetical protein [Rhizobium lentis]|uniref:hypothetical protein n=1 Tax=Rhizobium lentis TaxID=1138194 RepID=UPI001C835C86|nr:hypothetical protein [Rhizobium lentis]MBX5020718.1 hypothetical protein [Rhizobium lentis]